MLNVKFSQSISNQDLCQMISSQLANFIPDKKKVNVSDLVESCEIAMQRIKYCFSNIRRKYYSDGTEVFFDHLHSDHYCMYLYLLSNTVFKSNVSNEIAAKIFLLNKILHGIDVFYSVELPPVFLFIHPIGTVLGNAKYGNYFVVYQNCSVGALSEIGDYPSFGDGVVLYSKSSVLGNSKVGDDVYFGANSCVISSEIPPHSTVVGLYPNHRILKNSKPVLSTIFHVD